MVNTVLITGAGRGLGLSLTEKFLNLGYSVFAGYHRSEDCLRNLASVECYSSLLTLIPLDVTDPKSIRSAVKTVAAQTPALDILLNNAGVHLENKHTSLEELDFEDGHLEKSLAVNAFGPLRMTQKFLPLLQKGEKKLIINVSSEAGSIRDCWRKQEFGYCMSKAALNMQTKIMHNSLEPRGFRILAVHPGWMRTDMGGQDADIQAEEAAEGLIKLALNPEGKKEETGEEIFLDYQGKPLRW